MAAPPPLPADFVKPPITCEIPTNNPMKRTAIISTIILFKLTSNKLNRYNYQIQYLSDQSHILSLLFFSIYCNICSPDIRPKIKWFTIHEGSSFLRPKKTIPSKRSGTISKKWSRTSYPLYTRIRSSPARCSNHTDFWRSASFASSEDLSSSN